MVLHLPTNAFRWTKNEYNIASLQDSSSHGLGFLYFKGLILVLRRGQHKKCGRRHSMDYCFRMFGIQWHMMCMSSYNAAYILPITHCNNQRVQRNMIYYSKLGIHWCNWEGTTKGMDPRQRHNNNWIYDQILWPPCYIHTVHACKTHQTWHQGLLCMLCNLWNYAGVQGLLWEQR